MKTKVIQKDRKQQMRMFKTIRALEESNLDLSKDNIIPVGQFEDILNASNIPSDHTVKCLRACYPFTQLKKADNNELFVIIKMDIDLEDNENNYL